LPWLSLQPVTIAYTVAAAIAIAYAIAAAIVLRRNLTLHLSLPLLSNVAKIAVTAVVIL
jgi:hypothetical protein